MVNAEIPLISISGLKAYQRCRREYQYAYVMRRRPDAKSEPLELGTLVHEGLEGWFASGGDFESAVTRIRDMPDADPYLRAKAEAMLAGYHARWAPEADRYEVLVVEGKHDVRRSLFRLANRPDVIVRDKETGKTLLVEHKTAGGDVSPDSAYWAKLAIDPQLSIYVDASPYPIDAILYDVLVKPASLSPKKATPEDKRKYRKDGALYAGQRETDETVDEFRDRCGETLTAEHYVRHTVVRTQSELDQSRWEIESLAREALEVPEFPPQPRNAQSCQRGPWLCDYFDVCAGRAPIEDMPVRNRR